MTTTRDMDSTIVDLEEIGRRRIIPHGVWLGNWRRERDRRIMNARRTWTNEELSDARIAELVGCTRERVRQITDGV